MDLRSLISSYVLPTSSKISIFALFTGLSSFSIILLTPDHDPFVDLTLSLLFRINNLLLFLIKDVAIFVECTLSIFQ